MSMSSRPRLAAAAALLAVALGGGLLACGNGSHTAKAGAHVSATAAPRPSAAPGLAASKPVRVTIPAASVDAGPILDLGLADDGTVEVPSVEQADRIGWYDKGVTPGETGPAVLIGHYDTAEGPAVLKDVAKVRTGDRITVTRADGSTATFTVRELQQVDKKNFPTQKVYGNTDRPELRLITCGGDIRDGHRPDNIVLYADLTSTTAATARS
ncbi:class F sortase [Streptomyces sp. SCA3-4]|uniref:class F sortase n=1 Tax=Streptomyces sichuanensis TaxID=2871810 RepID=UPI001CE26772|nr:class F sortase [Streptomyces sichuanensis]MCA6093290.1 class F sortase [Streptomyces sichuanensis]MCA6093297.1 class F sortase [Streptomyces sichuanensis]